MRLMTKIEVDLGGLPSAEAIREWRDSPVTERFFNLAYRLASASPDVAVKAGFHDCQTQILDVLNDIEQFLTPPKKDEPLPAPDYGGDEFLRRRATELNA
jgi:hypothetical protein